MPLRLLGVFAHPEDAALVCGGTLARYARAGIETMVVVASPGGPGAGDQHDSVQAAARLLALTQLVALDYPAGRLAELGGGFLDELFLDILRSFEPHVVVTARAPQNGEPDHLAIRAATGAAFFAMRQAGGSSGLPAKLYEGIWPWQHVRRALRSLEVHGVDATSLPPVELFGALDSAVTTIVDVSAGLSAKVAAVAALGRPIPGAPAAGATVLVDLWGQEFFARAHPHPWVTGVVERDLFAGLAAGQGLTGSPADQRLAG